MFSMSTKKKVKGYQGNINLRRRGETTNFSKNEIKELVKCSKDPIYFIKNYVHIINLDKGKIKFDLYKYQEKCIRTMVKNKRVVMKQPRQSGKCAVKNSRLMIERNNSVRSMTIKELFDSY
jgi:superfamily II DNA or RNA helicase